MDKNVLDDLIRTMFKRKNKKLRAKKDKASIKNLVCTAPLSISELVDKENETVQPHRLGLIVEAWSKYQCNKDTQSITTLIFNATRRVYSQKIIYTNPISDDVIESTFVVAHMKISKVEYKELIKDLKRRGYTKRELT